MKFLSIRLFAPAPKKCKVDGGVSDEGHVGSRERESADGRDDESECAGPRVLKNVLRLNTGEGDSNRRLRAHGSEEKSQDKGYYMTLHTQLRATMEKAFRTYGCGNIAPIRGV